MHGEKKKTDHKNMGFMSQTKSVICLEVAGLEMDNNVSWSREAERVVVAQGSYMYEKSKLDEEEYGSLIESGGSGASSQFYRYSNL